MNEMEQMNEPLVSIVVITYNSSEYVIETLDSAKAQTYKNIELIVSDDGSTDETVAVVESWFQNNAERFVHAEIITVKKNTGIPANCNRGVDASKGEWVKIIAGDDILDENCIALNIDYVRKLSFPNIIVISNMLSFQDGTQSYKEGKLTVPDRTWVFEEGVDAFIQHRYAIRHYLGNTPTLFIAKEILTEVKFDERFPFNEDRPFAINATKKGYLFRYLNATTAYYRISNQSVYASKSSDVLFNNFYLKRRPFVIEYIYPHLSFIGRLFTDIEFYRMRFIDISGLNKNNFLGRMIEYLSIRFTPYQYWARRRVKKELSKEYWAKKSKYIG